MRTRALRTFAVLVAASAMLASLVRMQPLRAGIKAEAVQPCAVLSAASTHYHLGQTSAATQWQIVFPIRNLGARRLVLNELDPGCDCGDALHTIVVPPLETAEITVFLDTHNAVGLVESEKSFTTNDPQMPRLELKVDAVAEPSTIRSEAAVDDAGVDH